MSGMFGRMIVFLCCTGVGWELACRTGRRRQELAASAQLVQQLIGALSYSMKPAGELIEGLCGEQAFARLRYLRIFAQPSDLPFPERWRRSVEGGAVNLSDEERLALLRIGEVLGAYDLQAQQQMLGAIASTLQQKADELSEQAARDRRLYTSLGPLAGLAVCILL